MMTRPSAILGFIVAFAIALLPSASPSQFEAKTVKKEFFQGKVVPLAEVLKKQGVVLDADASPHSLVLVTEAGQIYVLAKENGARLFFKDVQLLNRPMRLTGRLIPGSNVLQVFAVHSYLKGKLHEVYYWCDTCALRYSEPGLCTCCGGPLELIEELVKE